MLLQKLYNALRSLTELSREIGSNDDIIQKEIKEFKKTLLIYNACNCKKDEKKC